MNAAGRRSNNRPSQPMLGVWHSMLERNTSGCVPSPRVRDFAPLAWPRTAHPPQQQHRRNPEWNA